MWVNWCMCLFFSAKCHWVWKYNVWLQLRGLTGYTWFSFTLILSFFWRRFIYSFLHVLWAYLGIQKFALLYVKKGWRKHHSFLCWNFQQIPCWVGEVQRWVSGVCRITQLPSLHLVAWLATGSYSFIFLSSLFAEKCSFEWIEIIYKAQLTAANCIGQVIKK